MPAPGQQVTPEVRAAYQLSDRQREVNTILAQIRRTRHGEPTQVQRDRLAVLRTEIREIKRGERDA